MNIPNVRLLTQDMIMVFIIFFLYIFIIFLYYFFYQFWSRPNLPRKKTKFWSYSGPTSNSPKFTAIGSLVELKLRSASSTRSNEYSELGAEFTYFGHSGWLQSSTGSKNVYCVVLQVRCELKLWELKKIMGTDNCIEYLYIYTYNLYL